MSNPYRFLFSPLQIGSVKIKNRIMYAPVCTNLAAPDGTPTDNLIAYLEERARGGAGLIIPGYAFIDDLASKANFNQIGAHKDGMVPKLFRVAEGIHAHGAHTFLQIAHGGRRSQSRIMGQQPVAPSAVEMPGNPELARELTQEEIADIVQAFAQAARRAQMAGFDGVELHGTHGYLIAQFLSPHTNRRTDRYGGDLNGRLTFALEVIAAVRATVGNDFVVGMRLTADDMLGGRGHTLDDTLVMAPKLAGAGLDYLSISIGTGEPGPGATSSHPCYVTPGPLVEMAQAVQKVVDIPVAVVGSILHPDQAEQILAQNAAQIIAMARPLIADPYLPNKAQTGQQDLIRPCIRCNECLNHLRSGRELRCSVNANGGLELRPPGAPASKPKRILVAGGGPAGIEAALLASEAGHWVTLYEASGELGGALIPAGRPGFKQELVRLRAFLINSLQKSGVATKLNTPLTKAEVLAQNPQAVIVATGTTPVHPHVPGNDLAIFTDAIEVLNAKPQPGRKTVVIGGGLVGCETALYLAQAGEHVTLVTRRMQAELVPELPGPNRYYLLQGLSETGVKIIEKADLAAVQAEGAQLLLADQQFTIPADMVVNARGAEAQNELYEELRAALPADVPVILIGDAAGGGDIFFAIHSAAGAVRALAR
ncbi:MAG TPA: FAD-dependent oxidoreductase [Firmicutes bacterium]|nr:FAD-dependent oxidoreductase [Bacillota bacterium]